MFRNSKLCEDKQDIDFLESADDNSNLRVERKTLASMWILMVVRKCDLNS